ncbi:flagellar biosynthesis protein FlgL [Bradyrhizobium sp. LHD-71]|uniref:flagellar biosynthesis protein FlgL n=1 Tax=Bradyrhizobium sp. LHD-71 TaxID=3072141 RepID=UPI00280F8320|nr:flagellar biosynthesis protein FlgL [Bradyrhizobium sp. LHD-71]MDQ8732593.1 flagellar biosynthesis protein FlgL [Bradyrhizobium sp. LHD-71]
MAINGIGLRSTLSGNALLNVRAQLEDLSRQLGTGKKSETYAGLGVDRSFAIGLRAQLGNLASYKDTIANVNTRLEIGNSVLQRMIDIGSNIKTSASGSSTQLENTGQTMSQVRARDSLAEMLQLLNTQSGDRYLFSGRATDTPAVASIGDILEGNGAAAGLKQIIAERKAADVGASGLGRLAISAPTATSVAIAEEADPLPFGMKLNAITSSLTGATVVGPTGTPPAISVDFAANPNAGDKVKFTFDLPDGTTEVIELTATTSTPAGAGEFTIGATPDATAANFQASLTTAVGKLANSSLVAASAFAASDNFFSSSPPLRVGGTPPNTATTLVAGTPANTVSWYTGEAGADPARGTAVARIDDQITVQYGARANEQGLRWQLQVVATYAAVTTSSTDPSARDQVQALNDRTAAKLAPQFGQQSIQDIQSELAGVQGAMDAASDRQKLTTTMTQTMLDGVEGVSKEETIAQILALQTNLEASYQVTSMLYQTSLVKFI